MKYFQVEIITSDKICKGSNSVLSIQIYVICDSQHVLYVQKSVLWSPSYLHCCKQEGGAIVGLKPTLDFKLPLCRVESVHSDYGCSTVHENLGLGLMYSNSQKYKNKVPVL
jgi:hypothetical protein